MLQVATDCLESHKMVVVGCSSKARQETNCKADINPTDHIGINELSQQIVEREPMLCFQLSGFGSLLRWSLNLHKAVRAGGREGNKVDGIRLAWSIPAVSFEHAINVRLATHFDVVLGLEHINTIESLINTLLSFDTHAVKLRLNIFADLLEEELSTGLGGRARGKVVNLTTDKNLVTINHTLIQILLMGGCLESHLIDEDISDQSLPKNVSFWVSLKCLEQRCQTFIEK